MEANPRANLSSTRFIYRTIAKRSRQLRAMVLLSFFRLIDIRCGFRSDDVGGSPRSHPFQAGGFPMEHTKIEPRRARAHRGPFAVIALAGAMAACSSQP